MPVKKKRKENLTLSLTAITNGIGLLGLGK
jgi:hypothetical protein